MVGGNGGKIISTHAVPTIYGSADRRLRSMAESRSNSGVIALLIVIIILLVGGFLYMQMREDDDEVRIELPEVSSDQP
jgi:hypothetical protein